MGGGKKGSDKRKELLNKRCSSSSSSERKRRGINKRYKRNQLYREEYQSAGQIKAPKIKDNLGKGQKGRLEISEMNYPDF